MNNFFSLPRLFDELMTRKLLLGNQTSQNGLPQDLQNRRPGMK
jgi:hypothetical protein